jgi:hypothetical protein
VSSPTTVSMTPVNASAKTVMPYGAGHSPIWKTIRSPLSVYDRINSATTRLIPSALPDRIFWN